MNVFFFVAACVVGAAGWLTWREHRLEVTRREWREARERALRAERTAELREQAAVVRAAQWVGLMRDQLDEISCLPTIEPNRTIR